MELPLSKLFTLVNSKLNEVFKYVPGIDLEEGPPTVVARTEELQIDDTFLNITTIMKSSDEEKKKELATGSG
jgi:hypothetical protein